MFEAWRRFSTPDSPDEVLTAMGEEGRLRALWEYYNVCCETRPGFAMLTYKPAMLTYKEGSYDLFHTLQEHLSSEQLSGCLAMQGPKHLRDFMVVWYDQLLLTL